MKNPDPNHEFEIEAAFRGYVKSTQPTGGMTDIVDQLRAYGELPFEGGDADPLIEVMHSLAHQAAAEIESLRAQLEWQPIDTWVDDGKEHLRGLWVCHQFLIPTYWGQYLGFVDTESWEFVDQHGEHFGWNMGDYTHWMPVPTPPEPTP